ncbi:gas vesicle protein [Rhodobacter sp. KR11]|jgi:hypothetical protein|uniref:gas vesicle protein n=1 Tax=Rhodobacter sp. KR11 TaxID=2974588 RepID=UPI002222445F|nr:gas vesicle protein [Rhodobacter sp. KR11]MCW1917399.1 gas vesicle protein [Rhodobacter sp. KR11]
MSVEMRMMTAGEALGTAQTRLVDVVDSLLGHGVVLRGELWISVAEVDLVFIGLDLVLAEPGKIMGSRKC